MSTARALANQKLYHAKILIESWRSALGEEEVASRVLREAFGPAICDHLAGAYGWFLLEVTQPAEMPPTPPGRCDELPAAVQGKEVPPEILEFMQLEKQPWLAQILDPDFTVPGQAATSAQYRTPGNLATGSALEFSPTELEQWHGNLSRLFDRMSDSLDEY